MAINLTKGGSINLDKAAVDAGLPTGTLDNLFIGAGWDTNRYDGVAFDLDLVAFLCNKEGKVENDKNFVYYGNKKAEGIALSEDNLTGEGDGDDENIEVFLSKLPAEVEQIILGVTIHKADERKQNFGMVENASIHVDDKATGTVLVKYDLTEDFSSETAIELASLYRHDGGWKFKAIGAGYAGGLSALCTSRGLTTN